MTLHNNAINHLQADYKANALAKAREYRKYSNLSKTKIYDWLTSPSIDKFTKEEANYAIQNLIYHQKAAILAING